MSLKIFAVTALVSLATASVSIADTICVSKPNQNGGTISVVIGQNQEGQPTISLHAQGGLAQFVTSEGPFVATAQHEPDGTFYSFVDNFGQSGTIAVFTSAIGGRVQTIASTKFGLWQDAPMYCH